jgi:hypothetical protein
MASGGVCPPCTGRPPGSRRPQGSLSRPGPCPVADRPPGMPDPGPVLAPAGPVPCRNPRPRASRPRDRAVDRHSAPPGRRPSPLSRGPLSRPRPPTGPALATWLPEAPGPGFQSHRDRRFRDPSPDGPVMPGPSRRLSCPAARRSAARAGKSGPPGPAASGTGPPRPPGPGQRHARPRPEALRPTESLLTQPRPIRDARIRAPLPPGTGPADAASGSGSAGQGPRPPPAMSSRPRRGPPPRKVREGGSSLPTPRDPGRQP